MFGTQSVETIAPPIHPWVRSVLALREMLAIVVHGSSPTRTDASRQGLEAVWSRLGVARPFLGSPARDTVEMLMGG